MNSDTGKVYTEPEEIEAAKARGENLVPIGQRAAHTIRRGRTTLAAKLREEREDVQEARRQANRVKRSRSKAALQKASRKANRRRP